MGAKLQSDLTPPTYEKSKPGVPEDADFGFRKGVKAQGSKGGQTLTEGSAESRIKTTSI